MKLARIVVQFLGTALAFQNQQSNHPFVGQSAHEDIVKTADRSSHRVIPVKSDSDKYTPFFTKQEAPR